MGDVFPSSETHLSCTKSWVCKRQLSLIEDALWFYLYEVNTHPPPLCRPRAHAVRVFYLPTQSSAILQREHNCVSHGLCYRGTFRRDAATLQLHDQPIHQPCRQLRGALKNLLRFNSLVPFRTYTQPLENCFK